MLPRTASFWCSSPRLLLAVAISRDPTTKSRRDSWIWIEPTRRATQVRFRRMTQDSLAVSSVWGIVSIRSTGQYVCFTSAFPRNRACCPTGVDSRPWVGKGRLHSWTSPPRRADRPDPTWIGISAQGRLSCVPPPEVGDTRWRPQLTARRAAMFTRPACLGPCEQLHLAELNPLTRWSTRQAL